MKPTTGFLGHFLSHWHFILTKRISLLVIVAAFFTLSQFAAHSQLQLEKEKTPSPSEIAQRLERYGGGWILHTSDREKLSFAVTNWNDVTVTNLYSYRVSPRGLTVRSGSDEKDIFLKWDEMPAQTSYKYQQVVAEAERGSPIPQPSVPAQVATPPPAPAYSPPEPSQSYVTPPSTTGGGKTVHVRGYTRKDGTYVAPHTRSAPRRK